MESNSTVNEYRKFLIFGVIGPIASLALIFADIGLSPWYSWYSNALSDLGVHPYSYLFNGGLIFEAIMNLIFVVALYRIGAAKKHVAVLLAISGISLGLVGVFNETHHLEHLLFALIYFILFPLSILLFASSITSGKGYSRSLSFFCAVVGLLTILVGILQDFNVFNTGLGLGVYEMIEAVLLSLWVVYTSLYYLGSRS